MSKRRMVTDPLAAARGTEKVLILDGGWEAVGEVPRIGLAAEADLRRTLKRPSAQESA